MKTLQGIYCDRCNLKIGERERHVIINFKKHYHEGCYYHIRHRIDPLLSISRATFCPDEKSLGSYLTSCDEIRAPRISE